MVLRLMVKPKLDEPAVAEAPLVMLIAVEAYRTAALISAPLDGAPFWPGPRKRPLQ